MSEEVRSDEHTIDPVQTEFPDGTIDPVLMEVSDGAMDLDHMKFPDGTIDPILMEGSNSTMYLDHMKSSDGTIDPILMEGSNSTMVLDHMKSSDVTMDSVHVDVCDSLYPKHMEDSDELDPDQVHKKFPDELWLKIKSFLNAGDLAKLGATSHRYNRLSKDPALWQKLIVDVRQINNHYQSLDAVIGRATQLKYITITDVTGIIFDEGSFVNGMPPDGDNINFDENAMVTLIEKAKATLISLTVGNDDEIDNELENDTTFKVTELDIELKNETIVKFGCLSQLESLELCGNDLSSSGVKAFAKLNNLKVLKIPGVCCKIKIKKTVLIYLFGKLKNLRVVDLSFHRITNETLSILAKNNPNLEEIKLYGCRGLNVGNFDVGSSMPSLRNLSLKTTAISKKGLLNMVNNCTQLSHLDLMWCYNFKKSFLGVLKKNCPNLEHLKLGYLPPDVLKKTDLSVFTTHFKKLKSLDLSEFSHPTVPTCADEEFMQAMANRGIEIELRSPMY